MIYLRKKENMGDPEIENIAKRQKMKCMWQISALFSKPIHFLLDRLEELNSSIYYMKLETTIMEHFIKDNRQEIMVEGSKSNTDNTSESPQSASTDNMIQATVLTIVGSSSKRTKKVEVNIEQKIDIAENYLVWLLQEITMNRCISNTYINNLIASIENYDLTASAIQNEMNFILAKVGPAVCFATLNPGEIPNRDKKMPSEKLWTMVYVNNNNRDRNIRSTKLDNIAKAQQIHKAVLTRKYEDQVDPAEFYRKLLENRSFPNEIDLLANKRLRLLCRTSLAERETYNLRRRLEKRVAYGDELREKIAREKHLMGRVEYSMEMTVATRDKARKMNKELQTLLSDYRVPAVAEYIKLSKKNRELKSIVEMWDKKVAVARLIEDNSQQQWRRINKKGPLTLRKRRPSEEQYTLLKE